MKRPDAEHLIMGLNSGAFQLENIVQQLSNPALQVGPRSGVLGRAVDPYSFFADPNPAVFLNADPDPGGKMNADPCGSGSSLTNFVNNKHMKSFQ